MSKLRVRRVIIFLPTLLFGAVACTHRELNTGVAMLGVTDPDPIELLRRTALPLKWPSQGGSPGLEALKTTIGDAQIVMLGEPWHGDGAAIRLRSELVRYLHEQLGFDVLVFESDFFAVSRGWEKALRTADIQGFAADNIYPFWASSVTAKPLWGLVEQSMHGRHPISIAGIDPKHVGAESRRQLPSMMDSLLRQRTNLTEAERKQFLVMLDAYLRDEQRYRPSRAEQRSFFAALNSLSEAFGELPPVDQGSFAEHEVNNLRMAVDYSWRGGSRDRAMGDNLAWLAARLYSGKRMIVWAHNNHIAMSKWMYFAAPDTNIARGIANQSQASKGSVTYLGAEARNFFGPSVVSVAILSNEGSYTSEIRTNVDSGAFERSDFADVATLKPAPKGTVESTLAEAGFDLAFVDLRRFQGLHRPLATRVFDYTVTPPLSMRLWEGYDAVVFIRSTFGLNDVPPFLHP